ncbi:hypothetical protein [Aquirufa echingensis]|jgi:hypothetical protein|uniref:Uncharacterized protein n=1 Tax=Aquirufa echingensis TaxID=3096516 RepID=A0ABW6D0R8_9BACT
MKSNLKDIFFFLASIIALYLLFDISQNGRYVITENRDLLDTRNGKIYFNYLKEKRIPGKPEYYWVLKYEEVK